MFARGGAVFGAWRNEGLACNSNEWSQMILFAPDHVILHLGGNDLTVESVPRTVGDRVLALVEELLSAGVRSVLVCEVVPQTSVAHNNPRSAQVTYQG